MDEPLDLVLARSSPLRDRSNEALLVEAYKTPKKRRSLGGEDVGRRRRPSAGSPQESDPRPLAEAEMMSFDEMRKQLSLWQSHLSELTAEHREAEKLRQDTSCLRSKLVNSEAEASERARRLVETRVQVQQKAQELATTQEQLNKKFIELAQEKEASQQLRFQISQIRDESEEQLKQKHQELQEVKEASGKLREELQALNDSGTAAERQREALEAELTATRAQLTANEVESSRLQAENVELAKVVKRLEEQLQESQADAQRCSEAIQMHQNLESELTTVRGALEEERKLSAVQQDKLCQLSDQASAGHLQLQGLELELAQVKDAYATFETRHHVEVQKLNSDMEEVRHRAERAEQEGEAVAQDLEKERGEVQRLIAAEANLKAALDGHSQQLAVSLQEQQQVQRQLQALQKVHAESLEGQKDREAWKTQAETEEAHAAALKLEVEEVTEALEAAQQETTLWKQRAEVMLGRRKAIMQVAARWQGSDAAWEWLMEQGQGAQELPDLPEGSELRLQNRELCLSLRQFKQDCELLESENLSLKEALTCMEEDLHRVSDQHAQLVGHVNHRQKIRYTMKLKEEINRLCSELKKARQRIVQLEVSKESESLFEALASVVGTPLAPRPKRPAPRASPVMPHRRAAVGSKLKGNKGDDSDLRLAEAEQLCMLQQSALDRISMDFQHLKALIERVVMLADTERRNGAEGGNFAALLHRLREIIAANHRTPSCTSRELGPLPVAATSITCDDDDMELAEGEVICYGSEQVPELS